MNQPILYEAQSPKSPPEKRVRVAITATHPIQHFCPFYKSLHADGRIDLRIVFGSSAGVRPYWDSAFARQITWSTEMVSGFESYFLPGADDRTVHQPIPTADLTTYLETFRPDLVHVYGHTSAVAKAAINWAKKRQRKLLYQSDSELRSPRPIWKRGLKRLIVPLLFRNIDLFLTVGNENAKFYRSYAVPEQKLFVCPFPIDEATFQQAKLDRERHRIQTRRKHNIPENAFVALNVGKLIERKRQKDVIEASGMLTNSHPDLYVLFVGDGPSRPELESLAKAVRAKICFAGFVPPSELPAYYLAADLYVHPSCSDPHPLAVSEAVYCGLPVLVSDRVGSVGRDDDVRVGKNGWEFPYGRPEKLAESIRFVHQQPDLVRSAGSWSESIGKSHSLRQCVDRYISACKAVVGDPITA